jgi:hypothetical protein
MRRRKTKIHDQLGNRDDGCVVMTSARSSGTQHEGGHAHTLSRKENSLLQKIEIFRLEI